MGLMAFLFLMGNVLGLLELLHAAVLKPSMLIGWMALTLIGHKSRRQARRKAELIHCTHDYHN